MFDFKKIPEFDKHIDLSIPNYSGLSELFQAFVGEYATSGGTVVDLGCSTGAFLSSLPKNKKVKTVGVDVIDITKFKGFDFIESTASDYLKGTLDIDVIVAMFSLQFMGREERKKTVNEIRRLVGNGATLLISEKCFFGSKVENVLKRSHMNIKRNSFTDKW